MKFLDYSRGGAICSDQMRLSNMTGTRAGLFRWWGPAVSTESQFLQNFRQKIWMSLSVDTIPRP